MRKLLLCFCWLLAANIHVPAQENIDSLGFEDESYDTVEEDESDPATYKDRESYFGDSLDVQRFDKNEWQKVVDGETYGEKREGAEKSGDPKAQDGGDEGQPGHMKQREEQETQRAPYTPGKTGKWLQTLLIALAVLVVLAVLFMLFKDIGGFGKNKKVTATPETLQVNEEEITERSTLEKLLRQALADKNYKLALRYYYLLMIAQYREQGLIQWRKDKTNYHYLRELKNHPLIADIRRATLLFEVAWYGDVVPDEAHMQQAQELFDKILSGGSYA